MPSTVIHDPDSVQIEGRPGVRYWVHRPATITGCSDVDDVLSSYPLLVFQPQGRDPGQPPLVLALQGLAAPWQWNAFLVPTLLDMGIACALFDIPMAGERSLSRSYLGDAVDEVTAVLRTGAVLRPSLVPNLMSAAARDISTVMGLVEERYGLSDSRRALFGVSLGTLLASFAFLRDGLGERLLGTIGHTDLHRFARSYTPTFAPNM